MSNPSHAHHSEKQTLTIQFTADRRTPCIMTATIVPNGDPVLHGLDLLNLWKDPSIIAGYPVLRATVSSPKSLTYGAIYGWVQITNAPGEPWVMDLYPPFQDVNSPFAMWGAEPTMVDAPGREGVETYDWTARSFLCYHPDAAMTKTVRPALAFEWGFWIEGGKPFVKELRRIEVTTWDEHTEMFREKFAGWIFEDVKG